ncbi:UNVERIFIED_CONTAM: hypothetical protein FKN15_039264 [Acipenser sinensis]
MNNAQTDINMSPDFVLMRLVSAADNLDEDNGNLSAATSDAFGASVLLGQHHNNGILLKDGFEFDSNNKTVQQQQQLGDGAAASPEDAMPTTRPLEPLVPPPPADPAMAQRLDLHRRTKGSRPQLMVFRNILRPGGRDHHGPGQHGFQMGELLLERHGRCSGVISTAGTTAGFKSSADPLQQGRFLQSRETADSPTSDWTPASQMLLNNKPDRRDLSDTSWASSAPGGGDPGTAAADPVFELARKFGEFGVDGSAVLFSKEGELPRCHCQSLLGSAGARPGEDPTETSDVLLVLEGLELDGFGTSSTCSEEDFKNGTAGDSCCPGYRQPQVYCPLREVIDLGADVAQRSQTAPDERSALSELASNPNAVSTCESTLDLPATSQHPKHKVRVSRCASSPLSVESGRGCEKTARDPGRSRKGSLKIRMRKLFRTRSCNGSSERQDKRHSVDSAVSVGSLGVMDISGSSGGKQDPIRKPCLSRTLSAFSPASFSTVFTSETVSLVDVDISRRGLNCPHPSTPPPPPRRSLSLLDDISGPQPGPFLAGSMGASLQPLPLPLPPLPPPPPPPLPSHATIQHSLTLNDTFLRALPRTSSSSSSSSSSLQGDPQPPVTQPPLAQALHCPLSRPDSCSFAASLRELEKCGWYWGPMNWEDAEMKLKGKPDGSFLVRDSSDPRYILSLSFRSQAITHHTRMEHYRGKDRAGG